LILVSIDANDAPHITIDLTLVAVRCIGYFALEEAFVDGG
jgi:hypothetical protein